MNRFFQSSALLLFSLILGGCSGIVSLPGPGPIVSPSYLRRYAHGGSMSTLWYLGSDERYHYFSHSYKTSTRYRVRRTDFQWEPEFPLGSRKPVFCSSEFQHLSQ